MQMRGLWDSHPPIVAHTGHVHMINEAREAAGDLDKEVSREVLPWSRKNLSHGGKMRRMG